MTGCNKCGEPTQIVEQSGGTKSGHFEEQYECVNGHTGRISGEASDSPQAWDRYGKVFDGC